MSTFAFGSLTDGTGGLVKKVNTSCVLKRRAGRGSKAQGEPSCSRLASLTEASRSSADSVASAGALGPILVKEFRIYHGESS